MPCMRRDLEKRHCCYRVRLVVRRTFSISIASRSQNWRSLTHDAEDNADDIDASLKISTSSKPGVDR